MTRYKHKIYEIVTEENGHLTADEIYQRIKSKEPQVALSTVYNNLHTLCLEGKIQKIVTDGMIDRYDSTVKHDHLFCIHCGKLLDAHFSDLTKKIEKELGVTIEGYDLKVNYICDDCKKKN